jgi:hypothetical protein
MGGGFVAAAFQAGDFLGFEGGEKRPPSRSKNDRDAQGAKGGRYETIC